MQTSCLALQHLATIVARDLLHLGGMQTAPQAIAVTSDSSPRLSGLVFELLVRSVGIALLGAGVLLTTLALISISRAA